MTLEDIFSLSEMKDGLTAPSRVEELVCVMRKEKDYVVKNISDATRQWTAVASTIAATEKRDCLDLFIQLDGLGFINSWLKDAQKFGNDTNESFIEECITAILRALEKLRIDNEKSVSSGIWMTVKSLLGHSSSRVQDRARALYDDWRQGRVTDTVDHDVESDMPYHNDGTVASSSPAEEICSSKCSSDSTIPKTHVNKEDDGAKPVGLEIRPLSSRVENSNDQSHNDEPGKNSDHTDMKDKPPDLSASSAVSNSVVENSSSVKEKSPIRSVEGTSSIDTCSSPVPMNSCNEGQVDGQKTNVLAKNEKQVQNIVGFPEKLCPTASLSISSTIDTRTVSSGADVVSRHDTGEEPPVEKKCDSSKGDLHAKDMVTGDLKSSSSEQKSGMDDMAAPNNCSTPMLKKTEEDNECDAHAMLDSYGNLCVRGKSEDLQSSFSRIKSNGAADESKGHSNDRDSDSSNDSYFLKRPKPSRTLGFSNNKTSDMELEYGIVDALEVARKVAQEVEREVVGYREPSCSSDKFSEGRTGQSDSPQSIKGKQEVLDDDQQKELPAAQSNSSQAHPEGDANGRIMNSDKVETEPENGTADMESSQVTEAAQEAEVNTSKGFCGFDLNQEVCSDDVDHPVNPVSAPVSVVSASRPAAPGLPGTPLQFEGNLGWKGSAATSAFRPASPRRLSESDKPSPAIGETSNSSKQRQDFLDIDLNVSEFGDDKVSNQMPEKQIAGLPGLHSTESSLEVGPKRSERLKLDLNRASDDGDPQSSDFRMEGRLGLHNRNGHHRSPSPASSSSSMQHSLRNFDLNDRPHWQNDISDQALFHHKPLQNLGATVRSKPDDPVISIMGARVGLNIKDGNTEVSSLPNGKALDMMFNTNMSRSGAVLGLGPEMAYTNSPVFGYNGLASAPNLSYSSAMYGPSGPVPYMMDSRGAPVVPQIVGSAAAAVPASYSQPSFILSMTGAPPGFVNGSGPSQRPSFDLNSGFPVEGGNRDSLGLRQLFIPNQGRTMEEHLRVQPSSSSGIGGKRKEPDSGWEPYPYNFRHQQPPWK